MDLVGEGEEAVIGDPDRPEEELESEERGLGQRVEGPVLLMKAGGGKTWVGKESECGVFDRRISLESVRGGGTNRRGGIMS